jgi:hypothetical protein
MKSLLWLTTLALLPACVQESPIAQEAKTAEQQLKDSISPFCAESCKRVRDCQLEGADDCPKQCADYMDAFIGHGDACVALGQASENCLKSLTTCDTLDDSYECAVPQSQYDQCRHAGPLAAGTPVVCDLGGTAGGVAPAAPGAPPTVTDCDVYAQNCDDGSSYRVSCLALDGSLVCNCFKDGVVSGMAFTPADGQCSLDGDINTPCGWNLAF